MLLHILAAYTSLGGLTGLERDTVAVLDDGADGLQVHCGKVRGELVLS
eukprot:CAMPEP_0201285494 /NCGR_PEP_ID=MMETSP1317-20130820/109469_1 /ASSEMBLY_ACC=CAM_ASM_000770 /TAXON_ID=187299 /ORGANISM="Undescribed Undescribed, Strain Undescribed" /LENGTH=47 /DNA_ID= /DNA_START= /DNA_END= /DNA_ORIENTATION=